MILVTGATGNVGRQVVGQLVTAGEKVRAFSRHPERAGLPDGVEVVQGDLRQPESLPAAMAGVDRLFLFPVPDQVTAVLDAATAAGVRRVVLLSSSAVAAQDAGVIGRMHAQCERAVAESGLAWTFLRPGAFMVNDLQWARGIEAGGVVRGPYGQAASAPIDERDIAAVAARALLDDGCTGAVYELTGSESLTPVDRVRILSQVLGRELRFEEQPAEQARELLIAHFPAEVVDSLLALTASAVGTTAEVLPTVRMVTGRAPHTYRDWATHHAGDFHSSPGGGTAG
ncbi:MAG TPA: SDR family oxidoreductase [Pseudonocardiaceae bacterium]